MYLQKHGITPEKVIEKNDDSVLLEFTVPETCDFFDGHFPEIQLLPAVAQIDLTLFFANKYLGTHRFALSTKRTKFVAPIFPNTTVHLDAKYNLEKNSLTYKICGVNGEKTFSTGTFALGA